MPLEDWQSGPECGLVERGRDLADATADDGAVVNPPRPSSTMPRPVMNPFPSVISPTLSA